MLIVIDHSFSFSLQGSKITNAAKTVGNGVKSGVKSFWSWGKNLLYKGAGLLAKIPKFFGRKK